MAKRRQSKPAPSKPPQSVGDALCLESMEQVTDKVVFDYTVGIFAPDKSKLTKKQTDDFAKSLFIFANLGWSVYHNSRSKD